MSVVIPTYNNAASLRRLLAAIGQAPKPKGGVEVVVVDDGSSDNTAAVCAEARVIHIWQRNAGTAAARDRGWRSSRGDIVVFFDDDTLPEPDVLTLFEGALADADGVGARFVALRKQSLVSDYTHADGLIDHRVVDGEVRWLITGAAAFRRSALERVQGFDLGFIAAGEDVDLSIRMLQAGCRLVVERKAVVHHDHRDRLIQLLETCYRYGTFSRSLATRHRRYRRERKATALRRFNPVDWVRLYRHFREDATRRRSLAFLLLHQLVAVPYALGVLRCRFAGGVVAAPSWRKQGRPAGAEVELRGAAMMVPDRDPALTPVESTAV